MPRAKNSTVAFTALAFVYVYVQRYWSKDQNWKLKSEWGWDLREGWQLKMSEISGFCFFPLLTLLFLTAVRKKGVYW